MICRSTADHQTMTNHQPTTTARGYIPRPGPQRGGGDFSLMAGSSAIISPPLVDYLQQLRRFLVMSGGGGGGRVKCRGSEGVRMPLLSGTDIIFVVNYIISVWLKHSFNTTGNNSIHNSRGDDPPDKFQGDTPPVPPGSPPMIPRVPIRSNNTLETYIYTPRSAWGPHKTNCYNIYLSVRSEGWQRGYGDKSHCGTIHPFQTTKFSVKIHWIDIYCEKITMWIHT